MVITVMPCLSVNFRRLILRVMALTAHFVRELFVISTIIVTPVANAMEPLSDGVLAETSGQAGMGLQLEMRFNANSAGAPLSNATATLAANPSDFTNCASSTDFSSTACRVAIQYAGRTDEWLVLKNISGRMYIPKMNLDVTNTPAAATAYVNLPRLTRNNGTAFGSPNNLPVLSISFKQEIEVSLVIGAASFENGATGYTNNTAYTSGTMGDLNTTYATPSPSANTSLMGIKIGNTAAGIPQAKLDIQGTIGVYGF